MMPDARAHYAGLRAELDRLEVEQGDLADRFAFAVQQRGVSHVRAALGPTAFSDGVQLLCGLTELRRRCREALAAAETQRGFSD